MYIHVLGTVYIKVCLIFFPDMDLREYLPSADSLLAAEQLGPLGDNANFEYLVRAGYEQIQRILT